MPQILDWVDSPAPSLSWSWTTPLSLVLYVWDRCLVGRWNVFQASGHELTWRGSCPESCGTGPHPYIIACSRTSSPVPSAEKQPRSMMLPPPCFTVGMVLQGGLCHTYFFWLKPKSSILVPSDQSTFLHCCSESLTWLWANYNRAFRWDSFGKAFFLAIRPKRLALWRVHDMVDWWTGVPSSAADSWRVFKVTPGLTVASLTNLARVLGLSFARRPDRGH